MADLASLDELFKTSGQTTPPSLQEEGYYGGALHLNVAAPAPAPEAAPIAAKPEAAGPGKLVRPAQAGDMELILRSLWHVESGNADEATSPKGAKGPGQIMSETAKTYGAKEGWEKGDANRNLSRVILADLHQKYGGWGDALAAYNAGPQKFDDWVAKGRPQNELGKQLTKYVGDVLGHAGLDTPGRRMADTRGLLSQSDLEEVGKGFQPTPTAPPTADMPYEAEPGELEGAEEVRAVGAGIALGAVDLVRGPIQFGLERIDPERAAKFTAWANQLDAHFAPWTSDRPYSTFIGRVIGSTAGILQGAKLIKPLVGSALPQTAQLALRSTPAKFALGAGGGAAAGATSYNPSEEEGARGWETAIGAIGGTLGVGLARSVAWTMRNVADRAAQSQFIEQLKQAVGHLGPNVSAVKDAVVEHVTQLERKMENAIRTRDAAGRQMEGFPATELERAADASVTGASKLEVEGVLARTKDVLGITEEKARQKAWEVEQAKFEKDMEKWQKDLDKKLGSAARISPAAKAQVAQQLGLTPPTAPAPFVPRPVSPRQFTEGLQYLNNQIAKAKGPKRSGLIALRRGLVGEAGVQGQTASGAKIAPTAEYFRAQRDIRATDKDVQAIARRFKVEDIREASPAKFYEMVTNVIEHGDTSEIAGLRKMLGGSPRLQEAMQNDVLHKMLMDAGPNKGKGNFDPMKIVAYITKHRAGLRELFGKDGFAVLEGQAKIAQRIAALPKVVQHGGRIFGWSGFLGIIGLEHAFRGHVIEGATLAASGFFAHSVYNFLSYVHKAPELRPLLRRAAKLSPGSRELDELISQTMMRVQARWTATGRTVGEETFGGEPE